MLMKGHKIPKIELNTVHLYQHYSMLMHNKLHYTWRGDYCECVRPAQLLVLTWSSNSVLPGTTSTIRCHRDRAGYNRQAIAQASELSFSVVFHTENCVVHSENSAVSAVYLPTPRWHLKALNLPKWIEERRPSHDIFLFKYNFLLHILRFFLSSFRITFWPMWLANSKGQPYFYPPLSHAQEHTELIKKITNLMGNLCCARGHSVQFFV